MKMKVQCSFSNGRWCTFDCVFDCILSIVQWDLNNNNIERTETRVMDVLTDSSNGWTTIVDVLFHRCHHRVCIDGLERHEESH